MRPLYIEMLTVKPDTLDNTSGRIKSTQYGDDEIMFFKEKENEYKCIFVEQNLQKNKILFKHTLYIRLKTLGQEKDGNGASHKLSKKVDQGYIRGVSKKFKSPESGRRKVLKSWTR